MIVVGAPLLGFAEMTVVGAPLLGFAEMIVVGAPLLGFVEMTGFGNTWLVGFAGTNTVVGVGTTFG